MTSSDSSSGTDSGGESGQRVVTKKDRSTAVKRELIRTRSRVRFTPGMRKAVIARYSRAS
jgi:hypothetical protein